MKYFPMFAKLNLVLQFYCVFLMVSRSECTLEGLSDDDVHLALQGHIDNLRVQFDAERLKTRLYFAKLKEDSEAEILKLFTQVSKINETLRSTMDRQLELEKEIKRVEENCGIEIAAATEERERLASDLANLNKSIRDFELQNNFSKEQLQLTNQGISEKDDETFHSRQLKQNLHKPDFKDCLDYKPEVDELQPIGTSVVTVKADDMDAPETGGTITYSIVSRYEPSEVFTVDNTTGLVTTKKVFDRDEPAREKKLYVTVRATDNGSGRSQLESVCTIKVNVLDVNDNAPVWEKHEYKELIPRDSKVGQVVMRISATEIDHGDNGTVTYRLEQHPSYPQDIDYFDIMSQNGEVRLKRQIDEKRAEFYLRAIASDNGNPPMAVDTDLSIVVIEENKKYPTFKDNYPTRITLRERGYYYDYPILNLTAESNIEDKRVFFELVKGQTDPTNKEAIFTLAAGSNAAHLILDRRLDYEAVSKYTLTIRAWNMHNLTIETLITIMVEDENDEKPFFTDVVSAIVLENEPIGTSVIRMQAIDIDGTSPNNEVTYYFKTNHYDEENFSIDNYTGEIKTLKTFDREVRDVYQVTVWGRDGAPSALPGVNTPNERPHTIKIEIADVNDNIPTFRKTLYKVEVNEDANKNSKVMKVRASDKDPTSYLTYSIISGNTGDTFSIESTSTSGVVYIKNPLDYEKLDEYELIIHASDSLYCADTKVRITVKNINDNPPVFEDMETTVQIVEESTPTDCIFRLNVYDPDIEDRTEYQNISFFMEKGVEHFSVGGNGCVNVIKPLDRDRPNGFFSPNGVQISVIAQDEWGDTETKLSSMKELTVILKDINDNPPFLNCTNPVVWKENQRHGTIIQLSADDNDTPMNGPPFKFQIAPNADSEITTLFAIYGKAFMTRKDNFDREERKEYLIPIQITDGGFPRQTGTSILTVIIGVDDGSTEYDYI